MEKHPDTYPVQSLKAWLEAAGIESWAVFRSTTRHGKIGARLSSYAVALVVKQYVEALGFGGATYAAYGRGWQPPQRLPEPASGPS